MFFVNELYIYQCVVDLQDAVGMLRERDSTLDEFQFIGCRLAVTLFRRMFRIDLGNTRHQRR